MYSFPAEGKGLAWKQGLARRIFAPDMVNAWRAEAGNCPECGDALEDGCVGKCLKDHLSDAQLKALWDQVAGDLDNYPNYPVQDAGTLQYGTDTSFCVDLSGGDSAQQTPIDLWSCNGLVKCSPERASNSSAPARMTSSLHPQLHLHLHLHHTTTTRLP